MSHDSGIPDTLGRVDVKHRSAPFPLFSVVILTRNRGRFLPRTLKAILEHDGPAREVLLFNNGSSDNTATVAREFPIRYFFTPELGLGQMRQRGLEEARGEFVVMCDDDCLPQAGWLESFLRRFRAMDSLALLGGKIINVGFEGISASKGLGGFGRNSQIVSNVPIEQANYFGCANLAIRRAAALQAGGFDPFLVSGYEEGDLAQSLQTLGYQIGYAREAAVEHHNVSATQRTRWRWRHNGVMRIYFHLKHFRPVGTEWIRFLAWEWRLQMHSLIEGRTNQIPCRILASIATFCLLPKLAVSAGRSRRALLRRTALILPRGPEPKRVGILPDDERGLGNASPAVNDGLAKRLLELVMGSPVLVLLAAYRSGLISFRTASELLAFIPGKSGVIWRRAWYRRTLSACGDHLVVEWMSVFKSPTASVGNRVYVGPFCWISRTHLDDDVMLAGRVTILSGKAQHGTDRIDLPMRQQPGKMVDVCVGRDVWVGDSAVVTTDVKTGTVVGAGSVVTRTFEDYSIIAGNPAKFIRSRGPLQGTAA